MRPDASENSQINPSTVVRAARAAGSQPYLPFGFQGRCKIATLHAGFGVIRGMSVQTAFDLIRADRRCGEHLERKRCCHRFGIADVSPAAGGSCHRVKEYGNTPDARRALLEYL